MIDTDSKQEILQEISAIRALLTRLQPVSGQPATETKLMDTGGGKRVLILF
jgi:hypothetical protein